MRFACLLADLFRSLLVCGLLAVVLQSFSSPVMTIPRQTNNSMSAGLFGDSSLDPESSAVDSSPTSATMDSVVPVLPPMSTPVAGSSVSASVAPDPAFLAAVVNAVKVALAAEQAAVSTSIAGPASSSPMPISVPGGVPSQDLGARTETFLASGTSFPSSPPNTLPSFSQGRPNYIIPRMLASMPRFPACRRQRLCSSPRGRPWLLANPCQNSQPDLGWEIRRSVRSTISQHCPYGTRIYSAPGRAFGLRAFYEKKSATDRGYWHLVRSLHDFFNDSDLALPSSLVRSDVLQVAHSLYTPAIYRASLATIR